MRAPALLLMFLALGGCAVPDSILEGVTDSAAGPEPVNYRFIVANGLNSIIGPRNIENRLLEISAPRRIDAVKGAVWVVCVKALRYPSRLPRGYYAVFIQREKIVDSRISVGLDQCEAQPYSPFEWSVDMDHPVFQ
jgi:hypothetical protein